MPIKKRITLHPLLPDNTPDESVNLYPKTLTNAIVDENGEEFPLQRELVSGVNIKTLNNVSLLGSGNIELDELTTRWGDIGGTLSDQTDLMQVLNEKENSDNKVIELGSHNTNSEYPSAKCVYDNLLLKENASNKVTAITDTSTDAQYPSAKSVYDLVAAVKRNSYIAVDTTTYPTLADFLASSGEDGYLYLYPIDTSDLSVGYKQYIWENNAWLYLGDTQLDLTPYVDLTSAQTITGVKTFSNGFFVGSYANDYISIANGDFFIRGTNSIVLRSGNNNILPYSNNSTDLGSSSYAWKDLYLSGKANIGDGYLYNNGDHSWVFHINSIDRYEFTQNTIRPVISGQLHLGSNTYKIGDIYQSGNLSNGTESYNIQDSYNLLFGKYTENNAMTELDYTQYCIIQLLANRIFTLKSAPYGCFPEYHFKVENTSSSAVTLTFPNNTVILTNDEDNVVVSSNTISLAGNTTIECSLVGLNLVAINFEVQ